MSRAVVAVVVGVTIALAACSSGGGSANPFGAAAACPILARLAQAGQTVAHANVSDPEAFETTLRTAVANYVRAAQGLRRAVPARLRHDVDRMIAAAQRRRFSDAADARNAIDAYARSECKTT
jgi:hypothetical protein